MFLDGLEREGQARSGEGGQSEGHSDSGAGNPALSPGYQDLSGAGMGAFASLGLRERNL